MKPFNCIENMYLRNEKVIIKIKLSFRCLGHKAQNIFMLLETLKIAVYPFFTT